MCSTPASILVIEDDYDIRISLIELLEAEGYSVLASANGLEGLQTLKSNPKPSVIVLDLMMPVMDGWVFRNHQLQDPAIAEIPVVVVTADGNAKNKAKSLQAAAGVRKPIELEEFLSVLRRV